VLDDIEAGLVNCVVVYKVDRLSRSLLDFARLMDRFDQRTVSFVAVTQQLNTTTSLGRLTLNILLSFAQFEREIIGERTRDKMTAARRKGKWVGGMPVLGYDWPIQPGADEVGETSKCLEQMVDSAESKSTMEASKQTAPIENGAAQCPDKRRLTSELVDAHAGLSGFTTKR
jgi:DNA invertase Pin-like site-specific DNA recombinase